MYDIWEVLNNIYNLWSDGQGHNKKINKVMLENGVDSTKSKLV